MLRGWASAHQLYGQGVRAVGTEAGVDDVPVSTAADRSSCQIGAQDFADGGVGVIGFWLTHVLGGWNEMLTDIAIVGKQHGCPYASWVRVSTASKKTWP